MQRKRPVWCGRRETCEILRGEGLLGEPGLAGGASEYDRHACMDLPSFAVGGDRHQAERTTVRAVGGEVERPESANRERAAIGCPEIIRGLQLPFRLPFVIAVDRDDAATMACRVAERRSVKDAFGARVGVPILFVGRSPGGHEAPRQRFGAEHALLAADGNQRRAGRNIITRGDLCRRSAETLHDFFPTRKLGDAATHDSAYQ